MDKVVIVVRNKSYLIFNTKNIYVGIKSEHQAVVSEAENKDSTGH